MASSSSRSSSVSENQSSDREKASIGMEKSPDKGSKRSSSSAHEKTPEPSTSGVSPSNKQDSAEKKRKYEPSEADMKAYKHKKEKQEEERLKMQLVF